MARNDTMEMPEAHVIQKWPGKPAAAANKVGISQMEDHVERDVQSFHDTC